MEQQIAAVRQALCATKIIKEDNVPCKIEEGLYLGSLGAANDKTRLKSLNITHILTVANALAPAHPNDFTYKVITVLDREDAEISQYFDECFKFIEEGKRVGGVLVHCYMGRSRSVTVVVSYLMKKHGMGMSEALKLVKSKRPLACPNAGFMLQLQNYEKSLRGMSDEAENARAVLAAYRSQNSKRPRRGEPSRSRAPRASPRSSPPGQVPVPRSRHSSASTTADNPAPGFAALAPGYAAPMGSAFAMPTASPSWPVSIPPSISLLQGDVLAEDVMRSLVSARDRESCRGRPDYRAMMEAMVRYGAMGDALEVEAKARQELEAQMGSLNLQCEQLNFQCEQMALRERRALEGQRAAEERSAMAVTRYRESSAFPVDVRAYISEHVEESYGALKATRAGSRYVAMEAAHMADIGEYDMQHKIYTQLRCRDPSFDPEAWGLPLELMDPEPQIEPVVSDGASGTGAALGDDPFPGLALGLGGAADTPLDQIRLSPGMVNFDQAGTSRARDP